MRSLGDYLAYVVYGRPYARRRRGKARRGPLRDWRYRAFIRKKPCACGCGRQPCHAAHTGQDGGMALKSSDRSCIPLYWSCHWEFDNGLRSGELYLKDHGMQLPLLVRGLNEEYDLRDRK